MTQFNLRQIFAVHAAVQSQKNNLNWIKLIFSERKKILRSDLICRHTEHLKRALSEQRGRHKYYSWTKHTLTRWLLGQLFFFFHLVDHRSHHADADKLFPAAIQQTNHSLSENIKGWADDYHPLETLPPKETQTQCSLKKAPSSYSSLCVALFFLHTGGYLLLKAVYVDAAWLPSSRLCVFNPGSSWCRDTGELRLLVFIINGPLSH